MVKTAAAKVWTAPQGLSMPHAWSRLCLTAANAVERRGFQTPKPL